MAEVLLLTSVLSVPLRVCCDLKVRYLREQNYVNYIVKIKSTAFPPQSYLDSRECTHAVQTREKDCSPPQLLPGSGLPGLV